MRLWPFHRRSDPAPVEVSPESLVAFLRAGGVVSMAEWVTLDPATQAALERAGTALWAERALALASCLAGGAADVARVVDGGAAEEDARLDALMTKALRGRVQRG